MLLHRLDFNMALQKTQITQQVSSRLLWFPRETLTFLKMNDQTQSKPQNANNTQKVSKVT